MNFKQLVQNDLNLFLDVRTFAENRNINGQDMAVIIDNDKLEELKAKAQYADGIGTAELLIIVRISDFGLKPATEQIITVDDDVYRVVSVLEANGVMEIVLRGQY